jgi:hypothetical protein
MKKKGKEVLNKDAILKFEHHITLINPTQRSPQITSCIEVKSVKIRESEVE